MIDVTDKVSEQIVTGDVEFCLRAGAAVARNESDVPLYDLYEDLVRWAKEQWAATRHKFGFKEVYAPITTEPSANNKLDKGEVPSYGLTLQHYVVRLMVGLVVNACPWAGDCTKVCVLDSGNGRYDRVQQARRARLEFMVTKPFWFFVLLGYEVGKAVEKHGGNGTGTPAAPVILFRPNVNSDVQWEKIAPSLVDGSIFGNDVLFYGYTKDPAHLSGDGWVTDHYRVSYSWNESSPGWRVAKFLKRGGSVAVVTNRKKGQPLRIAGFCGPEFPTVDADKTDEWMFESGVIGDLSAKGKARGIESDFVVKEYE